MARNIRATASRAFPARSSVAAEPRVTIATLFWNRIIIQISVYELGEKAVLSMPSPLALLSDQLLPIRT